MRFPTLVVLTCLIAVGSPANAAWHEAKSKHFIIYSDDSPRNLEQFALRLEKFDKAVRRVTRMDDPQVGDGNRLTIFVVPDIGAIQKITGRREVGGFYRPRATGSLAVVPKRSSYSFDSNWDDELIFFHEYAHHLMLQNVEHPHPEWMVEGFAEFVSTARFNKDGSILIGAGAQHRAGGLMRTQREPIETLLSNDYSKMNVERKGATVYAKGWLLTHFLVFDDKRRGQADKYVEALASGTPPLEAATLAFGDLKQFDREVDAYLRRISVTIAALRIPSTAVQPSPVEVRPLSPGAAAVIALRQRSKLGVNRTTAEPLAVEIRKVHARFPTDELVLTTLAEAEHDAGRYQAAEAAADAALKINPRNTEALIYKGRSIQRRGEQAQGTQSDELFAQARRAFIAANKIDPEDPEPLLLFYRAHLADGKKPTENAIAALHYASDLAPHDLGLRMTSGMQYLRDRDLPAARRTLALVAFNPHGGRLAAAARSAIAKIGAGDAQGALQTGAAESLDQPAAD